MTVTSLRSPAITPWLARILAARSRGNGGREWRPRTAAAALGAGWAPLRGVAGCEGAALRTKRNPARSDCRSWCMRAAPASRRRDKVLPGISSV